MSNDQNLLTKKYLQELAQDIMLELNDQEMDAILEVESAIRQKFQKVLKIDTNGVEPIFYPLETPHSFLREDKITPTIAQKIVLDLAPSQEGDFVTITKVVK